MAACCERAVFALPLFARQMNWTTQSPLDGRGWAIRPNTNGASDARIRDIIDGMIGDLDWDAEVGTLSGGQRRRVDLARVLIADADVLLLDEPTNHLDVVAINWLAKHLKKRFSRGAGALVVVTHDRWFLDEVCLRMWEVHDGIARTI